MVTLKVQHADFSQATRSQTGGVPVCNQSELEQVSLALLEPLFQCEEISGCWV
jgi:hypothetical protein